VPACRGLDVIWDPAFLSYDLGPNHPFQERNRGLAVDLLRGSGVAEAPYPIRWISQVTPASRADLARFHHAEYLDLVAERSQERYPRPLDEGDTPAFPGCFGAASRIVGGGFRGMEAIAKGGASRQFHPAGGLHHAHPDRASGFCIFNDIAVAIASHVGPGAPFSKVAYVDIDAHHGDGVMYGFYESGRVLDIDFHQDGRTLFPGTGRIDETGAGDGAGLKVNLPLPPGSGDEVLIPAFRSVVPTMVRRFRPEVIVLQHGIDGHAGDRLAGLRYGPGGYSGVLRELISLAEEVCEGRILVTGGGGYTPAHVTRVLARAGRLLAGLGDASGPLPPEWKREFARSTGEPAPAEWTDPDPAAKTASSDGSVAEFLLEELSERLGIKFPRVG
jgi:acetoin utilization protein AcuC